MSVDARQSDIPSITSGTLTGPSHYIVQLDSVHFAVSLVHTITTIAFGGRGVKLRITLHRHPVVQCMVLNVDVHRRLPRLGFCYFSYTIQCTDAVDSVKNLNYTFQYFEL